MMVALLVSPVCANIKPGNEVKTMPMYFDVGNPIKFGDVDYYFAWSSRPYDFYILQEYLPNGETFENYNRMFTVSVMFVGDTSMNSAKAVEYKVAELEETKKSDPVCNYLVSENDGEYIVDIMVSKPAADGTLEFVEADIHCYRDITINGIRATYLLFYSQRAYRDDIMPFIESIPAQREKWYKEITSMVIIPEFTFKN